MKSIHTLKMYLQPVFGEQTDAMRVMETLLPRRAVTVGQASRISGLSEKICRRILDELSANAGGRMAALQVAQIALEGQNGRPENFYLLAEEGADVLREITGNPKLSAFGSHSLVEMAHAYAEMELYAAAVSAKYPVEIEAVIPFAESSNIRADVLAQTGAVRTLFEVEQTADSASLPRILDKLQRLNQFFLSQQARNVSPDIRILFNTRNASETLAVWERALGLLHLDSEWPVSFRLWRMPVLDFLLEPRWETTAGFWQIEPDTDAVQKQLGEESELEMDRVDTTPDLSATTRALRMMRVEMKEAASRLQQDADPRERCAGFLELASQIYQASYYHDSPCLEYGQFPRASLDLLRHYLNLPENRELLEELKQGSRWLKGHGNGSTNYRVAATRIIWDIFLRWHGFARGGMLRVNVDVPDYQSSVSDYRVLVTILNRDMQLHPIFWSSSGRHYRETCLEEEALAWVLTALFQYSEEIGLGAKPWRGKDWNARRGGRQRREGSGPDGK